MLSYDELAQLLYERRGATMITVYARTEPEMCACPYSKNLVWEWGRQVVFGTDHARAVMRRWAEVGCMDTFESDPLWCGKGQWLNPYMRWHENGRIYLYFNLKTYPLTKPDGVTPHPKAGQVVPCLTSTYRLKSTGAVVAPELVSPFLKENRRSKKQRVEELGCVQTFPQTVKFTNLVQINMDGECYPIGEPAPELVGV